MKAFNQIRGLLFWYRRGVCRTRCLKIVLAIGLIIALPLLSFPSNLEQNEVLTITVSHSATGAIRYFKEGLSKEGNYYLDQQISAYWAGKTSRLLGLDGKEVSKEAFSRLVNNLHPYNDTQMTPRNHSKKRAGVDLTFSASKDFSLLYAFTKSPELLEIHREAVRTAMSETEKLMYTQSNSKYARGYTHTGNIVYAAFDHFLSRPVETEQAGGKKLLIAEPQLHTHCFVPNVTWNNKTGRYHAIEIYSAHMNSDYIRSVYHSAMAIGLERSGYQTQRDGNFVKLAGVSRDIIERFSSRSQQINQISKDKGLSAKEKGELGAKTRLNKGALSLNEHELLENWKGRLSPGELAYLQNLKNKRFQRPDRIDAKAAIDRGLEHYLERNSVINEKKVIAHALTLGYGHLDHKMLSDELNSRDNILRSRRDTIDYVTTREMVHEEDRMISRAVAGKGKFPALNKDYIPKLDYINTQQRTAIKEILCSYDQTIGLSGAAGVGKTSLLTEVRKGVTESGKSLLAVAPSSQAVEVLREKGFEANTISALLTNPKLQQKLQRNVLLVDEAGMVGVKSMSGLLELANKYKARSILSGDTKQISSPSYGDALRILETKANLQISTVNKIVRQRCENYRSAVEDLAKAKILKGYQKLDKQGAVHEISDHEERLNRLAQDYVDTLKQKRSALIVSPTNIEGTKISEVVRAKLKKEKRIQGNEKVFETLRDLSLTEAQKKDALNYRPGHMVRFTKNTKGGFRAGSHYEVLTISDDLKIKVRNPKTGHQAILPNQTPENYSVYRKQQLQLAKGDLIRLTNNAKSLQGTKMSNGTNYQIRGFNKRGIELSNGKTIPNDLYHIKYGYCETGHSSQGKDAKKVIISIGDLSYGATNEQIFYVSVSRGTEDVAIYCSDKSELKKTVQRSGERLTAGEIADDHYRRLRQRKQRNHYHSINQSRTNERFKDQQKAPSRSLPKDFSRR